MKHSSFLLSAAAGLLAAAAPARAAQDFNGDGYGDLAIGVPYETLGGATQCGAVQVLSGTGAGLGVAATTLLDQSSFASGESKEAYDRFGSVLAWGDFNGDGYDDLAVGTPNEDNFALADTGSIQAFYGGSSGLGAGASTFDSVSLGVAQSGDRRILFGFSLAAGDFNGDGYDDLASGAPYCDVAGKVDAGAVSVLYGAPGGLSAASHQMFTLYDFPGQQPRAGDLCGYALAAGDFTGDGRADLAVGIPTRNTGSYADAGAVGVLYGAAAGLPGGGAAYWAHSTTGYLIEAGMQFGFSLAAGDFDADGRSDLAVGAPYDDVDGASNAGGVSIFYGHPAGLLLTYDFTWAYDATPAQGELFGYALATGRFDWNSRDDLAVGVPLQDFDLGAPDAGAVALFYGQTLWGTEITPGETWSQGAGGLADQKELGDNFGWSLGSGDFNGDGVEDLVAGAWHEDLGAAAPIPDCGALHVVYGSKGGLTGAGSQFIHQNSYGVPDACETGDVFGAAVTP